MRLEGKRKFKNHQNPISSNNKYVYNNFDYHPVPIILLLIYINYYIYAIFILINNKYELFLV